MKYLLCMPKNQYDQICNYFAEPSPQGKAAFLLTNVIQNRKLCRLDVSELFATDELRTEAQISGFSIQSPLMMDAIDHAMETCKSFLFLYSDPAREKDADTIQSTTNQIVLRIAYHYLPTGLHVCLAYKGSKLTGTAWLKDASHQPMQILIKAS